MLRARFLRELHLLQYLALFVFRGGLPHQALTLKHGLRTVAVRCTCGREWS